ncbi:MAG: hypothetical protein JNM93_06845 [Bacteriovoracaceae bacterium]|nr:hypothetical protein [Bacteriovoracaceae bacterium]
MKLLCFAHRGEALAFLKNWEWSPLSVGNLEIYQNETAYLLITGEGMFEAMNAVSTVLGHQSDIKTVYNLGVCGRLNDSLALDQVYSIRTVYANQNHEPLFKSFTSADKKSTHDLLTYSERVTDEKLAKKLSPFAPLVDRELWSIAYAAHKAGVNFIGLKYISDNAGNLAVCELVKEKAQVASEALLDFYLLQTLTPHASKKRTLPEGFYFTYQQKIQFTQLIKKLELRSPHKNWNEYLSQNQLQKIEHEKNAKKKTALVLNALSEALNPEKMQLQEKTEKIFNPILQLGGKVLLDKNLETSHFEISFPVTKKEDLIFIKRSLDLLDYEKYERLMNGET